MFLTSADTLNNANLVFESPNKIINTLTDSETKIDLFRKTKLNLKNRPKIIVPNISADICKYPSFSNRPQPF